MPTLTGKTYPQRLRFTLVRCRCCLPQCTTHLLTRAPPARSHLLPLIVLHALRSLPAKNFLRQSASLLSKDPMLTLLQAASKSFQRRRNKLPKTIVIYQDGISAGEYRKVDEQLTKRSRRSKVCLFIGHLVWHQADCQYLGDFIKRRRCAPAGYKQREEGRLHHVQFW